MADQHYERELPDLAGIAYGDHGVIPDWFNDFCQSLPRPPADAEFELAHLSASDRARGDQLFDAQRLRCVRPNFWEAVEMWFDAQAHSGHRALKKMEEVAAYFTRHVLLGSPKSSRSPYHVPPDRQWMMALETQYATRRACAEWRSKGTRPRMPSIKSLREERARQLLGVEKAPHGDTLESLFSAAETFAWSSQCSTAAWMASKSIPLDSVLDMNQLPARAGWWWFDGGIDNGEVAAMLWGPDGHGQLALCCFVPIGGELDQGFSFTWKWGSTLNDLVAIATDPSGPGEPLPAEGVSTLVDCARFFLAGCIWLQQKVMSVTSGHIERHRRKQLAREFDVAVSEVKVVQLRRLQSDSKSASWNDDEPQQWSCRWVVRGHWRNQFHPSTSKHQLKYILPYVKGPEDAPLRTPTVTVFAVNR